MKIKDLKQYEGIICPTKKILKKILKLNNDTHINPDICFNASDKVVYYPKAFCSKSGWSDLKSIKEGSKTFSHKIFLKPKIKNRVKKIEKSLEELDRIVAGLIINNDLK
jgi:hypothetical protein